MIPENIIISRTDGIGNVVRTLSMAKIIKEKYPACRIAFLGKEQTRPIIRTCIYIDQFISLNDFMNKKVSVGGAAPQCIIHVLPHKAIAKHAKEIGIDLRIGTSSRIFHWTTCNKLVKLNRKKSGLPETELNLKLLSPLGITVDFPQPKNQNDFGLSRIQPLAPSFARLIDPEKYNIILDPKSTVSDHGWGFDNFTTLINSVDQGRFKIFITGTEEETPLLKPILDQVVGKITDLTGKMDLYQFTSFINRCDGLLAGDTGPLYLAAALGKDTFGLFPALQQGQPGRIGQLGENVVVFKSDKPCRQIKMNHISCDCISAIKPSAILEELEKRYLSKKDASLFDR